MSQSLSPVTFRRIVIPKPGGYERLEIARVEQARLAPGAREVLIEVEAAGVNYADCVIRMGLYESAKKYVGYPITPGFEFSGRVLAVGTEIGDLEIGAAVFGVTRFGGYASHVVVPRSQLFKRPPGLSAPQAAAFPTVFLTAYYPLYELMRLRPGYRVLIHSAAGGVGGALIQLAKVAGCEVVGVVGSSHKAALARELGADHVIDKSHEPLWERAEAIAPGGYDVILDANGVSTLGQSYGHLAPAGKLVIYGFHSMLPRGRGKPRYLKLALDYLRTPRFNPLRMTGENRSVLAFNLSYLFDRQEFLQEAMCQLGTWLEQGKIRPLPVKTYPYTQVAEAHRALESAQTTGKLALTFASHETL